MIKINDTLKCLNNRPLEGNTIAPPLKVDENYPALQIHVCNCGQDHIDVGLKSQHNYISCYKCKEHLPETSIHWCHPSRFEVI